MTFKTISLALSLIAGAGAAHLAMAQSPSAPAPAQQSAEVTDSDLALFRKASNRVAEVRQEYQQVLQQAESAEEAQTLQQEASQTMVDAVQSFGLTVDKYNQIAAVVQADPDVRERLNEMGDS